MSEIALTYEKARLHGARCASRSDLDLDQKHLTKEKTALLAVVSSRVCMNMEITGHFFVCRRFENSHLPKSSRYTTKRCPFSILLCYHKYQNMSKKMTVLVKFSVSNPLYTYLFVIKKGVNSPNLKSPVSSALLVLNGIDDLILLVNGRKRILSSSLSSASTLSINSRTR